MTLDFDNLRETVESLDKLIDLEQQKIETMKRLRRALIQEAPKHFANPRVREFYIQEKERELKALGVKLVNGRLAESEWGRNRERAQNAMLILHQIRKARSVTALDTMREAVDAEPG